MNRILKLTIRVFISGFASKNIDFLGQTFRDSDRTKSGDYIRSEYNLVSKFKHHWIQLADDFPELCKDCILNHWRNLIDLCLYDHHVIKKNNLPC